MIVFLYFLLAWGAFFSPGAEAEAPAINNSGLPLPRFASLKYGEVNLHVGPGRDYPIEWKLVRQSMPVEVTAEFDNWRRIRDFQGTTGWVHKSSLSGKETVIVKGAILVSLRKTPDLEGKIIMHLEPGVIGEFIQSRSCWSKIRVNKVDGWVDQKYLWGPG
jgi:SH3-like domain-containing protein